MVLNSSSSSSFPSSSSNASLATPVTCNFTKPSFFIFITHSVVTVLVLLPLCVLVVRHGLQQWRSSSSSSSSSSVAAPSHADIITYHMVAMEIIGMVSRFIICFGVLTEEPGVVAAGEHLYLTWLGQVFFHILTCVERHLAVVHPVTYRNLRGRRGVWIRDAAIGCVWLICCIEKGLEKDFSWTVVDFCFVVVCGLVVSVCSASVLLVLARPGPGRRGGAGERLHQSKRRAFCTMLAILGTLTVRFFCSLVWNILTMKNGHHANCTLKTTMNVLALPSSLVLPLLLLHRAGQLKCHPARSGQT